MQGEEKFEELKELFTKLDKGLALLTQEVSYIRTTIDNSFSRYDKWFDSLDDRVTNLESWKLKIAGIIIACTVIFGFLYDWIRDKVV